MGFIKKYLGNFVFSIILSGFLIIPNFIINNFWNNFYIFNNRHFYKEVVITFIISLIISFLSKKMKIIFSILFILLEIIQIGFYGYFRNNIMPFHIDLLFSEYKDIFLALKSIVNLLLILFSIFIILMVIIYLINKVTKPKYNRYVLPFLLFLFIIFPLIIKNHKSVYVPTNMHFAYLNTLFAINLNIINKFDTDKEKFLPYKVIKINDGKPTVIVIMGESLNFRYMHLFGYKKQNTPFLDSLKQNKNFVYKKAISSGVNTTVAVRNFFYVKREPFNENLIASQKTNLMKLAKQNGYKTYWYSMQMPSILNSTILSYATYKKIAKNYPCVNDENLIKDLQKIDLSAKSFIVLHFRINHSPYENYTPKNFWKWNFWKYKGKNYHKYMLNSYMNSILYVDYLIYQTINYMKNNHHNFVIYYVSDHGEMLGSKEENGKYGHTQLNPDCAKIPFLYYSDKYHKDFNRTVYNHYLISKIIAEDLGYKIINPNENNNTYYIQAPGKYHEMIKYNLNNLKWNINPIKEEK